MELPIYEDPSCYRFIAGTNLDLKQKSGRTKEKTRDCHYKRCQCSVVVEHTRKCKYVLI